MLEKSLQQFAYFALISIFAVTIEVLFSYLPSSLLKSIYLQAVKYDFVVDNEDVFTPCEDFPDNYIDKFFDISGLSFEREGDLVKVVGDVKLVHEFENDVPIQLDAQVYRRSRGEWVDTIYNIRRPDFCPVLYNGNELWYKYTNVVPEADRKCPPQPGLTISFDSLFGLSYDLQDRSADGDYKLRVMMGQGKELMCFEIECSVYKE